MNPTGQALLVLTSTLLSNALIGLTAPAEEIYKNQRKHQHYDFIIVGAGSAGSVIANRLSEDRDVKVLLLEAGGLPTSFSKVPLFVPQGIGLPGSEWGYYTVRQKNACLGLEGQKSFWSRYKGLGGCSTHNHMIYNRGKPKDYDNWERNGAKGWSWKDVLPFYKKLEDYTSANTADKEFYGTGGNLTVSAPRYENKLREAYLDAGKSLGYEVVDYNEVSQTGFSSLKVTQRKGRRCSTEKAFLRPAAGRPNLDILTHATALSVKFDKNKRARSVVYEQDNRTLSVSARREIILSAGAIGSAQILMLSGIGPEDHLEELQIPVVANLPVGQNLQDHVTTGGLSWSFNSSVSIVFSRDIKEQAIADFQVGKGPLTSPGSVENMIYVNSKYQNSSEDWPDIQIQTSSTLFGVKYPGLENKDAGAIFPIVARPKTRGVLKLRSKNPSDHPILDYQYFTEEQDLLILVEGMKFARKMISTPALQRYGPKPILEAIPQCQHIDYDTDEYLICTALTLTQTVYHQSGTVRMGATSDPTTVLDPQLRVKGIQGLRVADASVMPLISSGTLNAPCMMIGEKAAHMIRNATGKK